MDDALIRIFDAESKVVLRSVIVKTAIRGMDIAYSPCGRRWWQGLSRGRRLKGKFENGSLICPSWPSAHSYHSVAPPHRQDNFLVGVPHRKWTWAIYLGCWLSAMGSRHVSSILPIFLVIELSLSISRVSSHAFI